MKPGILVMGICGTGKSTIGKLLSEQLGVPFIEADDFHPISNVEKMQSGSPLNDADRQPWLEAIAKELKQKEETGFVLACSALKEKYRTVLFSSLLKKAIIIQLDGDKTLIQKRMTARSDHFMPTDLINSQLADLEPSKEAIHFDISNEPNFIVKEIIREFQF